MINSDRLLVHKVLVALVVRALVDLKTLILEIYLVIYLVADLVVRLLGQWDLVVKTYRYRLH